VISFTTANYVARETGWAMHGWGHGDGATNAHFAPIETYRVRLEALFTDIVSLGFDTIDLWGAHLNPDWATEKHITTARWLLDSHGLNVASYAVWVGPANVERACELAIGIGTDLIGAGFSGDPARIAPLLGKYGIRLGIENHPEKTPAEVLAKISAGDGTMAATVDTGWWATQGYDPVQAIEELGEHVVHVHLKDVRAAGEPHETCPWGEGIVDVEACVRALQRLDYGGALTVEHEPEDHDPSEEIKVMRETLNGWLA
jgi:L-ribulose-5-phosphate 3-epimerase